MLTMIGHPQQQEQEEIASSNSSTSSSNNNHHNNNSSSNESLTNHCPTDSEQHWQHIAESLLAENEAQRQLIDTLKAHEQLLENESSTSSSLLTMPSKGKRISRCESEGLDQATSNTLWRSIVGGAEGTLPINNSTEPLSSNNDMKVVGKDNGNEQHFHDSVESFPEASHPQLQTQTQEQGQEETSNDQHSQIKSQNAPMNSTLSSTPSYDATRVFMVSSKLRLLPREVELGNDCS
jgi:hypothetical protein